MDKDDPIMAFTQKVKDIVVATEQVRYIAINRPLDLHANSVRILQPGFVPMSAKLEAYIEIATKIFPDTILRDVCL